MAAQLCKNNCQWMNMLFHNTGSTEQLWQAEWFLLHYNFRPNQTSYYVVVLHSLPKISERCMVAGIPYNFLRGK